MATQRMFHGHLTAAALADQLAARFNERHQRTHVSQGAGTALVQIGSQYGTPLTLNIAETEGGVLVTMSADHNWLDRLGDAGDRLERAARNPLSLLTALPDILAEGQKKSLAPDIWSAVDDICGLTRALAGEKNAPPQSQSLSALPDGQFARARTVPSVRRPAAGGFAAGLPQVRARPYV